MSLAASPSGICSACTSVPGAAAARASGRRRARRGRPGRSASTARAGCRPGPAARRARRWPTTTSYGARRDADPGHAHRAWPGFHRRCSSPAVRPRATCAATSAAISSGVRSSVLTVIAGQLLRRPAAAAPAGLAAAPAGCRAAAAWAGPARPAWPPRRSRSPGRRPAARPAAAGCRIQDGAAAEAEDPAPESRRRRDRAGHGVPLERAERRLAVVDEDVADRLARDGLHAVVGVSEPDPEQGGEQRPDRGLSRAGRPDQDRRRAAGLPGPVT